MRSSRLLKLSKHKFTELNKNQSPTRMPEARHLLQQHQNLSVLAPGGLRVGVSPGAGGLGLSNVLLGRGYNSCSNPRVPSLYHGESVLLDRISFLKTPITIQPHRSFTKKPDLPKEANLNQYGIKRSLRLKAIEYTETYACIKIDIPIFTLDSSLNKHFSPTDIGTPTIHINKRTGNFVVPSHGVYGTWQDLELLINIWVRNRNKKKHQEKEEYPVMNTIASSRINLEFDKKFDGYKAIQSLSEKDFESLLNNLNLSEQDYDIHQFSQMEAKVDKNLKNVIFPIRYMDGTLVGYRILSGDGDHVNEYNYPNLTKQSILPFPHGLYEASITSAEGCILVGSMVDSLSLSRKTRLPVITLPESGNLHPDHIPFFDQFESICIWLDNNVQGSQNAKMFAQKMGDKKCRIVSSINPKPSLCKRSKTKIKEILSEARSNYHESLITFEHLRDDVYLEFLQNDELMGVKFDRFNCLKNTLGGFRRGELTIFSGRTGSGKTTFLSEYSLDLCGQGVNTLWCSFEVRNTRLLRIMMKQFSLINIDEHTDKFEEVADQFTKLPLYLTDFHGSQNIDRVVDAMSHAVYVHDITHVIVDNMQFMLGTGGSGSFDRFGVQDQAIEMFRKFATAHNCHVTLVIHPRKEDDDNLTSNSIFGGAKATQEADNVLLLQEEKVKESFFKKKCIEVVKNRYAGNLGKMNLMFCKPINTMSRKAFDMYKGDGDHKKPPPKSAPPKPTSQPPKISMQPPIKDSIQPPQKDVYNEENVTTTAQMIETRITDDTTRLKDKVILEDDEDIFITTDFFKPDQ